MATEYVCSSCGHTFRGRSVRGDAQPEEDCPACGADAGRLWSVGVRDGTAPLAAERRPPAARPAAPTVAAIPPAKAPGRRRLPPLWRSIIGRLSGAVFRSPQWRHPGWPRRRTLLLALVLALCPLPLDDDRLPVPGPGRSASGPGSREPVGPEPAAAEVSIADLLRRPPPRLEDVRPGATTPDPRRVPGPPASPPSAGPGLPVPTVRPGLPAEALPAPTASAPTAPGPIATADVRTAPPITGLPGGVASPAAGPGSCVAPDDRRLVFLIDVSVSMGLPHRTDPEAENALDEAVHAGDAAALARYRALLAEAGAGSRLGLARDAFAEALDATPPGIEVGVVSFHGCRDIRRLGPVARPGFAALRAEVGELTWHRGGETALSEALREAYAMTGGQSGRIAVITDGKDTCGPPPCEVIEVLRRGNPGVRVDVVDVSGRSDAACLALVTGGTFRVAPLSGASEAFLGSVAALGRACPIRR